MAVAPTNALYNRVADLNRLRNTNIGKTALAGAMAPGTSGPAEAYALGRSMFPKGEGLSPEATLSAKMQLLDRLADMQTKREGQALDFAGAMQKRGSYVKEILDLAGKVFGAQSGALADIRRNLNDRIADLSTKGAEFKLKAMETALGTKDVASAREALASMTNSLGKIGVTDPNFAETAAKKLAELSASPGAATAFAVQMDAEIEAQLGPGQNLGTLLQGLDEAGVARAAQGLDVYNRVARQSAEIQEDAIREADVYIQGGIASMSNRGVLGSDKAVQFVQEMMKLPELANGSPEELQKALDDTLSKVRPAEGDPDALKRYDDLLTKLDNDNLPPTSNLAEARRRLIASKDFQDFKAKNQYQTDGMALKELRRLARMKLDAGRQHDLEQNRRRRLAEVGPGTTDEPSTSAKLVSAGGDPVPPKTGPVEQMFVLSPTDELWLREADGSFHKATDEDWDQYAQLEAEAKGDLSTFLAQGPDVFDEFQREAEARKPKAKPTVLASPEIDAAKAQAALPTVKSPTVPMMAQAVGSAITHPANTVRDFDKLLREKVFGKRKPDVPEETPDEKEAREALERVTGGL